MENSTLFASTVIAVAVGVLVGALPFILLRVRSGSAANNESRDIERLVERIGALERCQDAAGTSIQGLAVSLAGTGARTETLVESANAIRDQLAEASKGLTELRSSAAARQDVELETPKSIRRVEAIIAGTNTRGAAGEKIIEAMFSRLPAEWQVYDFRVAGGVVEFGLRSPNNLVLPTDHKWPAVDLLDGLAASDDPNEQARLKRQVQSAVRSKVIEV